MYPFARFIYVWCLHVFFDFYVCLCFLFPRFIHWKNVDHIKLSDMPFRQGLQHLHCCGLLFRALWCSLSRDSSIAALTAGSRETTATTTAKATKTNRNSNHTITTRTRTTSHNPHPTANIQQSQAQPNFQPYRRQQATTTTATASTITCLTIWIIWTWMIMKQTTSRHIRRNKDAWSHHRFKANRSLHLPK